MARPLGLGRSGRGSFGCRGRGGRGGSAKVGGISPSLVRRRRMGWRWRLSWGAASRRAAISGSWTRRRKYSAQQAVWLASATSQRGLLGRRSLGGVVRRAGWGVGGFGGGTRCRVRAGCDGQAGGETLGEPGDALVQASEPVPQQHEQWARAIGLHHVRGEHVLQPLDDEGDAAGQGWGGGGAHEGLVADGAGDGERKFFPIIPSPADQKPWRPGSVGRNVEPNPVTPPIARPSAQAGHPMVREAERTTSQYLTPTTNWVIQNLSVSLLRRRRP